MNNIQAQKQFLFYVKRRFPSLYHAAANRVAGSPGLNGLGITVDEMLAEQDAFAESKGANVSTWQNILTSFSDTVKDLAPAYVGIQQAKTCIDVNAQRAKQGLSPVDCASAGLTPQVNVGVSKEIQLLAFVALGIGALYLFMRKR